MLHQAGSGVGGRKTWGLMILCRASNASWFALMMLKSKAFKVLTPVFVLSDGSGSFNGEKGFSGMSMVTMSRFLDSAAAGSLCVERPVLS